MTGDLAASHNAYLSVALTFGAPAGILVFGAIVVTFMRIVGAGAGPNPALLPLVAMTILFFAEDSLFSISMQMALAIAFFSVVPPLFVGGRIHRSKMTPSSSRFSNEERKVVGSGGK